MEKQLITLFALAAVVFNGAARQPQRGYRGFLDWSNSLHHNKFTGAQNSTTNFYTGFSTSHGYQITPWIFTGLGFDFERCEKAGDSLWAAFVQGRTDLKFGKFTPFGDIRIGYSFSQGGGVYFSPTIGYRFNWGRKIGVNIGLGITLRSYTSDIYQIELDPESGYWGIGEKVGVSHDCDTFFSFRLGFDF